MLKFRGKSFFKKVFFICLAAIILVALFVVGINAYMINYTRKFIYRDISQVPARYVAIVPGARVYSDNVISFVFRDRIAGGMDLLERGTVQKVLVSGDHGRKNYDEVNAARIYIKKMYNVDESLIFMDHAGFSTYETMYRARDVFCVKDAVIVTQRFHLYRSLYIARKLGLNAVAYEAPEINGFHPLLKAKWEQREMLARVKTFFLVMFKVKPTYLGSQIPITGDGHATWE